MAFFFRKKPLWKGVFCNGILVLRDCLNKVKTKSINVIKSFEMTLNSKYLTEKIKTKTQRYRNMKNQNACQNTER